MISTAQMQRMQTAQKPRPSATRFGGGLDLVTPPMAVPPGFLRFSVNWEADVNGGYARTIGYERYDGQPSPSDAVYYILFIDFTAAVSVGQTLTGGTSSATGEVIAVTAEYAVITKMDVSTFQDGEDVNNGGGSIGTTASISLPGGAATPKLHAQYKALAANVYRADIAEPDGIDGSLGGVRFEGVTYTFRNNADDVHADLWASSGSGWTQVPLLNEIAFTAGGASAPTLMDTLTQGGVTAIIMDVVLESGSWSLNSAAGRLIIDTPSGGSFSAGAATDGGIGFTLVDAEAPITLLKDGRYQFIVENFAGGLATKLVYGVDGVNRGFQFDGEVLTPINTGMSTDAPTHVHAHKNHLFFSFAGSAQHSGPGTPFKWSVILGAAELGIGDTVTGFMTQPGSTTSGALSIFARNLTTMLYGTGVSDWQLVRFRQELGAYPYTIQDTGMTMFLDDKGITTLQNVQAFGNFAHNAISVRVKSFINEKRLRVVESCVCGDKNQYRIFFSDGYALFVTFISTVNGLTYSLMPILFPNPVTWAYTSEESDGTETIFFGSTNGMVYQMERGTSFDGAQLDHAMALAWDFLKSPRTIKHFYDCTLEVSGVGYAELNAGYEIGYGSAGLEQPESMQTQATNFSIGRWDMSGVTFDQGGVYWDGTTLNPSSFDLGGDAVNISLLISGSSDYQESFKVSGAVIHWAPRREARG